MMKILPDGSVEGVKFTKNEKCPYPSIMDGESPEDYRKRVDNLVETHEFHLGDLSWGDYEWYCRGSGMWRHDD